MISATDFLSWARKAEPRTSRIYYVGDLSFDREIPAREKKRICALAHSVLIASQLGVVDLAQRKIEDGVFEYRAIKRRAA